jgi:hypothetical protein
MSRSHLVPQLGALARYPWRQRTSGLCRQNGLHPRLRSRQVPPERPVLKGGVLLAAIGERRPTRDIDLQASVVGSDTIDCRCSS